MITKIIRVIIDLVIQITALNRVMIAIFHNAVSRPALRPQSASTLSDS